MTKKFGEITIEVRFTVPVSSEDAAYMKEEGLTAADLETHAKSVMEEIMEEVDSEVVGLEIKAEYKGEAINA